LRDCWFELTLEILALGTRVGGSRSPQRDGKTNRGSAAHLYPSVRAGRAVSEKPIHPRYPIFKHLLKKPLAAEFHAGRGGG